MKTSSRFFSVVVLGAALAALPACSTVPETGRKQVNLLPESQIAQEASMTFAQMKTQTPVSDNAERNAQVRRVGMRIVEAARRSGAPLPPAEQWEFVVFQEDKTINAFALPGGKIGVYTGMYKIVRNDDDLAVVLGHEVAHVAAHHGNERVSQALLAGAGGVALGVGVGQSDLSDGQKAAILAAYGAGATIGVILPYSRLHESEADRIGLSYMARAGYNPYAAVPFWERMKALAGGNAPPVFLSTHPPEDTRIRDLQKWLPAAVAEYDKARAGNPPP